MSQGTTENCNCPHCAGPIVYNADDAGRLTACPHCAGALTLPAVVPTAPGVADAAPGVVGLACPYCRSPGDFISSRDITGAGWAMIFIGLLLCPVLVGIPILLVGCSTRAQKYQCCNCGKAF